MTFETWEMRFSLTWFSCPASGRMGTKNDTPERIATAHCFRSIFRDWVSDNGYARDIA